MVITMCNMIWSGEHLGSDSMALTCTCQGRCFLIQFSGRGSCIIGGTIQHEAEVDQSDQWTQGGGCQGNQSAGQSGIIPHHSHVTHSRNRGHGRKGQERGLFWNKRFQTNAADKRAGRRNFAALWSVSIFVCLSACLSVSLSRFLLLTV